jgi:4'-phosphopantetheinyl transferase EntD
VTGDAFGAALQHAIDALAIPGLLIGQRVIAPGDENALREGESASRVSGARRASGAARIVARELLARFGYADATIPTGEGGAPIWPTGVVGSLTHDDDVAVAAVALRRNFASIGIDVEPARELPADLLELIASAGERHAMGGDLLQARLLFAAKEAAYKAVYPLDGTFLEFQDIEVDLPARTAVTRTGRTLSLGTCVSPRIVALALIDPA